MRALPTSCPPALGCARCPSLWRSTGRLCAPRARRRRATPWGRSWVRSHGRALRHHPAPAGLRCSSHSRVSPPAAAGGLGTMCGAGLDPPEWAAQCPSWDGTVPRATSGWCYWGRHPWEWPGFEPPCASLRSADPSTASLPKAYAMGVSTSSMTPMIGFAQAGPRSVGASGGGAVRCLSRAWHGRICLGGLNLGGGFCHQRGKEGRNPGLRPEQPR